MSAAQSKPPTLAVIAERIAAHLRRFEASHDVNAWDDRKLTWPYAKPRARACGARVEVTYHYAVAGDKLSKGQAAAYLAWLDAGNVGRHWERERAQRPAPTHDVSCCDIESERAAREKERAR